MSADIRGNATAELEGDGDLTPGQHLRAEIERLGLDQVAVSRATGVSRQSINNIVNGRQPISRAMAGKLGRLTGQSSDYWLRASFPRLAGTRTDATRTAERDARPFGVGVMVNHQILRAVKDGVIGINPFAESNVRMAEVDLTLDDFVIAANGEKVDISRAYFTLKSGSAVNVSTKEWIELPQDYIGRVGALASLAVDGIMASHAFQIGPGFRGNLRFCVFNIGRKDFELRSGMTIIGVEFMQLSATPRNDEKMRGHASVGEHGKPGSNYRSDACARLIREAVRARAQIDIGKDGAKATIIDLNIEVFDHSRDAALEDAVQSALGGLKTLRERPNSARDDRERYAAFFGDIAERLYLSGDEARSAIGSLGLPIEAGDALIATLRNGADAVVPLPTRSGKVSLRQLARQLREDPLDLIVLLTFG